MTSETEGNYVTTALWEQLPLGTFSWEGQRRVLDVMKPREDLWISPRGAQRGTMPFCKCFDAWLGKTVWFCCECFILVFCSLCKALREASGLVLCSMMELHRVRTDPMYG